MVKEVSKERKIFSQIEFHRKMSNIDRLSDVLKNKKYSLAEHSYYVTTMFQDFAIIEDIAYTVNDLYFIARHDFLEVFTGDLSSVVKNFSDKTKEAWETIENEVMKTYKLDCYLLFNDKELNEELNEEVIKLLKACDLLDLYLFCIEETTLGNNLYEMAYILEEIFKQIRDLEVCSVTNFMLKRTRDYKDQMNYYKV